MLCSSQGGDRVSRAWVCSFISVRVSSGLHNGPGHCPVPLPWLWGEMARIPSGETRACFPLIPPGSYPASLHRAGGWAAHPYLCCAPGPLQEAGLGDRRKEKPTPCPGRQSLGPRISAHQQGRLSQQIWFSSAVLSTPPFSDRWFILLITSPCP